MARIAILLATVAWLAAVIGEVPYLNGPSYWQWPWHDLPLGKTLALSAAPALLYATLLALWVRGGLTARRTVGIALGLVVCCMLFQLAMLHVESEPWKYLRNVVETNYITSYYTDATHIRSVLRFLRRFHRLTLEYHSETHPPGPILFYYLLIKLAPSGVAPVLGGLVIGAIASFGVLVAYACGAIWTDDPQLRLGPCFVYTLLPALILFLPELDQIYPILTMALLVLWHRVLEARGSGVWLGILLFVASLLAYNLATLGAPLALLALWKGHARKWERAWLLRLAREVAVVLGVFVALHLTLHFSTGYRPIEAFERALRSQAEFDRRRLNEGLDRPYRQVIFFDLYDFLLGGGLITGLVAACTALQRGLPTRERTATAIGLLAILIVDLSGLLQCETARVWLFLQPFVVIPAGLAIARWPIAERCAALLLLGLAVATLKSKVGFLF